VHVKTTLGVCADLRDLLCTKLKDVSAGARKLFLEPFLVELVETFLNEKSYR